MQDPPRLCEIQRAFFSAITRDGHLHHLEELAVSTDKFPSSERCKIYQDAYFRRLETSIAEDFPQTQSMLGAELFSKLVRDYIQNYPSREANLAEYSRGFLGILKNQSHEVRRLAAKEWYRMQLSAAKDHFTAPLELGEELAKNARLVRNSTTCLITDFQVLSLAYLREDEAQFQDLDSLGQHTYSFFEVARSLSELEDFAISLEDKAEAFANLISLWLSERILICQV